MITRSFWTRNPNPSATGGSSSALTRSGKQTTISGPYELTSKGRDTTGRDADSETGSQEYIFGKGADQTGVMVHTTYQVTSDEETGNAAAWKTGRGGVTEASVTHSNGL